MTFDEEFDEKIRKQFEKIFQVEDKICEKCGVLMSDSGKPHYVNGHLQCACGKNIDECCQGETANELES
jgi:hypothetical protein